MQLPGRFFKMGEGETTKTAVLIAILLSFLLFLTTLQLVVNGLSHPYTTDVGEIQNALPRWGTLHFTGYPQYTALGSLFVTLLRPVSIAPTAGASLYSAVWGAVAIGLLAWLVRLFDVPAGIAVLVSLLFALSKSMWIDASIAELHTMTMALTFAALLVAVRFGRHGRKSDLYWLAFLAGQGVAHQRAFAFLAPALLVLVIGRWRVIWRHFAVVIGLGLLGPLTYLYLPLRAWMGADWVFSAPGTWDGFWALLLDTKAERIIELPQSLSELWQRAQIIGGLLNDDWPWPLWALGLLGLWLPGVKASWVERLGLTLGWLLYLVISLIIWEGHVSDALLAVKLPVIAMAAVGLGFTGATLWRRASLLGWGAAGLLGLTAVFLFFSHRAPILEITRDNSAQETIALASRIPPDRNGRDTTLMALWGDDYWQLAYAQAYQNRFPHLELVDHRRNFAAVIARNHRLLTLSRTFYQRPRSWWEQQLKGPVYLSAAAPGVIEIAVEPQLAPAGDPLLDLGNGIVVREASLAWKSAVDLVVEVVWQAAQPPQTDYSVAVHLVSQDPPAGPQDIVAQADRTHPVDGWYPTSSWQPGEVVYDYYLLQVPPDADAKAVRVSMYRVLEDGQFENSAWLSLPVPARE